MRRHTLLIDAGRYPLENNVFFEKLIARLHHSREPCGYTRAYIRHILNETETEKYPAVWLRSSLLRQIARGNVPQLAEQNGKREHSPQINDRVVDLERTPPKILDGVPETLAYLTERHRLILFTKGEPAEQAAKVERSGLQGFFRVHRNCCRKDHETYGGP